MSNRRETIKKALGLSEYPWSSDEEDNIIAPDNATSRRQSEMANSNVPENSGMLSNSEHSRRRSRGRMERDLYWSLLNNPMRASQASVSGQSASQPGPSRSVEPTESRDLTSPLSNLQRILAIKRLPRNQPNSRHCIHPFQLLSTIRDISSRRRTDSASSIPAQPRSPTDVLEHPALVRYTLDVFNASRHNVETGQETRNPSAPNSPERRTASSSNSVDGRSTIAANTSSGRAAAAADIPPDRESETEERPELAEDVMEIDGTEDENQPDDNVSNQAQASGEEEENEEEAVEDAPVTLPSSPVSQGTKRKREVSANGDFDVLTVQDLNRSLLQLLECPVCLEWMEPPMAQCRRGHLVCVRCRARLATCPVCRTTFSSVRNRAMEGVAEMLRYPCRHGCGRETRLRQRGSHEASCEARRYRCPAASCTHREPLPLSDLQQHFQTCHMPILKVGSRHRFSLRMNVDQHDDWLVMVGRDLFYMRVDVNIRTWGIVVHVAYIGPKCNANLFTYEVTVSGLHNERKLVYTRETHSDLESTSLNVCRQDCFHLSLDQALNFLRYKNRHCEPDKYLDFIVEITKLDPPAQDETTPDLDS